MNLETQKLVSKYNVNINQIKKDGYDLIVFRCQACADDLQEYNPYIYEDETEVPLNKIKVIVVDDINDCENEEENLDKNPDGIVPIDLTKEDVTALTEGGIYPVYIEEDTAIDALKEIIDSIIGGNNEVNKLELIPALGFGGAGRYWYRADIVLDEESIISYINETTTPEAFRLLQSDMLYINSYSNISVDCSANIRSYIDGVNLDANVDSDADMLKLNAESDIIGQILIKKLFDNEQLIVDKLKEFEIEVFEEHWDDENEINIRNASVDSKPFETINGYDIYRGVDEFDTDVYFVFISGSNNVDVDTAELTTDDIDELYDWIEENPINESLIPIRERYDEVEWDDDELASIYGGDTAKAQKDIESDYNDVNIEGSILDFKCYLADKSNFDLDFKKITPIINNNVQLGISANDKYIGAFNFEIDKLNDKSYRDNSVDKINKIACKELQCDEAMIPIEEASHPRLGKKIKQLKGWKIYQGTDNYGDEVFRCFTPDDDRPMVGYEDWEVETLEQAISWIENYDLEESLINIDNINIDEIEISSEQNLGNLEEESIVIEKVTSTNIEQDVFMYLDNIELLASSYEELDADSLMKLIDRLDDEMRNLKDVYMQLRTGIKHIQL